MVVKNNERLKEQNDAFGVFINQLVDQLNKSAIAYPVVDFPHLVAIIGDIASSLGNAKQCKEWFDQYNDQLVSIAVSACRLYMQSVDYKKSIVKN